MKRHTALRTVEREHPEKTTVTASTPVNVETAPLRTEMRSIMSTLGDMERMFEEAFHRPFFGMNMLPFRNVFHELGSFGEITPHVDMYDHGNEVVVSAELPGIKREEINVKLVDNTIIISGEKKTEEKVERSDYLRLERTFGSFNRTLNLPEGLDSKNIKASFKDGVLEVRIPKLEGVHKARKITVE
jgi:HSP20 family protein